jgi:hypothetical protein
MIHNGLPKPGPQTTGSQLRNPLTSRDSGTFLSTGIALGISPVPDMPVGEQILYAKKMKTLLKHMFLFAIALLPNGAIGENDPFAEPPKAEIDTRKSANGLTDSLLKAFEEEHLDKGTGKGRPVIRITILRSFDAPLMFKWFPGEDGEESFLIVKKLQKHGEDDFHGLETNKRMKLSSSQEKHLQAMFTHSPLQDLPQEDWQLPGLDGSEWIYEAAAGDAEIMITRVNPVDPVFEGEKIAPSRLAKELQLTSFTMMLWMLSGIDERAY